MSTRATWFEFGQVVAESNRLNSTSNLHGASGPREQASQLARIKELFSRGNATQVALYQAETDASGRKTMLPCWRQLNRIRSCERILLSRDVALWPIRAADRHAQTNFMSACR